MRPPVSVLAQSRIRAAYGTAIAVDVLQLALGPFGWVLADEILDVVAMSSCRGSVGSIRCCCRRS
jgi:hypothetical protein